MCVGEIFVWVYLHTFSVVFSHSGVELHIKA